MKALIRWAGIAVGGLVVLALIGYAVLYGLSERALQRTYPVPVVKLVIPTDPASIREGQRQVAIRGCFGCHGENGQGQVFFDEPIVARLTAPNLTEAVRRYSDAQLAVIIRYGLRPDGRSVLVMPSEAFIGMTDEELARTIAYLKSLPQVSGPPADITLGPVGRFAFATDKLKTVARLIADTVPPPPATNPQAEFGRHLARTICAECHGTSLEGDSNPDFTSPSLRVVAAYSPEAFTTLMRTGVAVGGRTLGIMSVRARKYLTHLNDDEIAALYSYLHGMAGATVKQ